MTSRLGIWAVPCFADSMLCQVQPLTYVLPPFFPTYLLFAPCLQIYFCTSLSGMYVLQSSFDL